MILYKLFFITLINLPAVPVIRNCDGTKVLWGINPILPLDKSVNSLVDAHLTKRFKGQYLHGTRGF